MICPIPSIDLLQGQVVRLKQGIRENVTVYHSKPKELIKIWRDSGCKIVHIVDLDAAFGTGGNQRIIDHLLEGFPGLIQVAGGVRSLEDVERHIEKGAQSVVIGTLALKDPKLTKQIINKFQKRITLALDGKMGIVHTKGWTENSGERVEDVLKTFLKQNLFSIMYTEIDRDGMGVGSVNPTLLNLLELSKHPVIASGGVGHLGHILELEKARIPFCIIGKALHEEKISLASLKRFWS